MSRRTIILVMVPILCAGSAYTDGSGQLKGEVREQSPGLFQATAGDSVVATRLLIGGSELEAYYVAVAPDGTRIAYVDWDTGSLMVRDLATEKVWPILDVNWGKDEPFSEVPIFSPDGGQVAFATCCEAGYALRIGSANRTGSRVILSKVAGMGDDPGWLDYVKPVAWSPTANEILTFIGYGDESAEGRPIIGELVLVDPSNGSYRSLARANGLLAPRKGGYSPDGDLVVFTLEGPPGRWALWTLDPDSGKIHVLQESGVDEDFVGWNGDGSGIFYLSEGELRLLPLENGFPVGVPETIYAGARGWGAIGTAGSRAFLVSYPEWPGLHTASIDVSSGKVLSPPVRVEAPRRAAWGGAWSNDGQFIAYPLHSLWLDIEARPDVAIRYVDGDDKEVFTVEAAGVRPARWVRWMPGDSVLLVGFRVHQESHQGTVMFLDLDTGEHEVIGTGRFEWGMALSKDGSTLVALTRSGPVSIRLGQRTGPAGEGREQGTACIVRSIGSLGDCTALLEAGMVPASNEGTPLVKDPCMSSVMGLALSPDGSALALATEHCIALLSPDGSDFRWISRGGEDFQFGVDGVEWSADGSRVLAVRSARQAGEDAGLWIFPVDGTEPRKVFEMPNLARIDLHPDGRRILFHGGGHKVDLWAIGRVH